MNKLFLTANVFLCLFALLNSSCKKKKADIEPASLAQGLVAYYPFTGNANDLSGNANNGQVVGATLTTDRKGLANSAYAFDANQQINIPGSENKNTYPFTISLWVKIDDIRDGSFFSKYNGGMWNGFQLGSGSNSTYGLHIYPYYLNGGSIPNGIIGNYGQPTTFIVQNITTTEWIHCIFSVSDAGGFLYKNGVLVDQISWRNTPGAASNNLICIIGGQWNINNNASESWFKGKIDDIRIYNRALSASEVAYLAAN